MDVGAVTHFIVRQALFLSESAAVSLSCPEVVQQ